MMMMELCEIARRELGRRHWRLPRKEADRWDRWWRHDLLDKSCANPRIVRRCLNSFHSLRRAKLRATISDSKPRSGLWWSILKWSPFQNWGKLGSVVVFWYPRSKSKSVDMCSWESYCLIVIILLMWSGAMGLEPLLSGRRSWDRFWLSRQRHKGTARWTVMTTSPGGIKENNLSINEPFLPPSN